MPYCTEQDMIDRYGDVEMVQLTDRDNLGVIDSTVLMVAIENASALMDGYIGSRYALPLSTVPRVLELYCADLARYFLYDDRATKAVERGYNSAMDFLKQVSSGRTRLGLSDTGAKPKASDGATMQSGGRTFGRDDNGFM
ncbi:MAG: phage protein Gp36 family protein [Gammaproteobacteria bacterium]|nr:phage protein Gp36 family protein [Gammaproteobacteria bacterium]